VVARRPHRARRGSEPGMRLCTSTRTAAGVSENFYAKLIPRTEMLYLIYSSASMVYHPISWLRTAFEDAIFTARRPAGAAVEPCSRCGCSPPAFPHVPATAPSRRLPTAPQAPCVRRLAAGFWGHGRGCARRGSDGTERLRQQREWRSKGLRSRRPWADGEECRCALGNVSLGKFVLKGSISKGAAPFCSYRWRSKIPEAC
jgi:hypothetical protein